jgi:hypothetical protein
LERNSYRYGHLKQYVTFKGAAKNIEKLTFFAQTHNTNGIIKDCDNRN